MNDLAQRLAAATSLAELGRVVEGLVRERLAPHTLWVVLQRADDTFHAVGDPAPAVLAALRRDGGPFASLAGGVPWLASRAADADGVMRAALAGLEAECVAPIVDRQGRLVGMIVLGARRATDPYRDEDLGWLASIAGDAGLAVEVLQRAERLAARMAHERREHQEIAIASEVQRRLFPQRAPELAHVALAARCIQARAIGGDYYDFLDLGPGRVGLVLADVSGKGVHAALRMANLQAHLRSQAGSAPQDPLRVMRETNRLLYESTQATHFATVFLGVLASPSRRLTYVNCGHNPALCVRIDGTAEWLGATATVLGAFEPWECALGRSKLGPGDMLVVYSDGVTEAERDGRHFGEQRLLDLARAHMGATPEELVSVILETVQDYGDEEQIDDLTVMVAKGR